jgi:hypothetical protein
MIVCEHRRPHAAQRRRGAEQMKERRRYLADGRFLGGAAAGQVRRGEPVG